MPKLTFQLNSVPKLILRAEVHRLVPKLFRAEITRAEHRSPHLKTFTSESNNFESAAIRYLPKELLTTKITKRHHDLKSVKSQGSAKAKKKHLRQVLMTHYVELI